MQTGKEKASNFSCFSPHTIFFACTVSEYLEQGRRGGTNKGRKPKADRFSMGGRGRKKAKGRERGGREQWNAIKRITRILANYGQWQFTWLYTSNYDCDVFWCSLFKWWRVVEPFTSVNTTILVVSVKLQLNCTIINNRARIVNPCVIMSPQQLSRKKTMTWSSDWTVQLKNIIHRNEDVRWWQHLKYWGWIWKERKLGNCIFTWSSVRCVLQGKVVRASSLNLCP